jgi:hypothetical protein
MQLVLRGFFLVYYTKFLHLVLRWKRKCKVLVCSQFENCALYATALEGAVQNGAPAFGFHVYIADRTALSVISSTILQPVAE